MLGGRSEEVQGLLSGQLLGRESPGLKARMQNLKWWNKKVGEKEEEKLGNLRKCNKVNAKPD